MAKLSPFVGFPLQRNYFDTIFSFLFPNTAQNVNMSNVNMSDNYFDQVLNYIMQNDPKYLYLKKQLFIFITCR